jgi:Acetyltransferase (GNAT) domain
LYNFDPCGDVRWSRFLARRDDSSVFHAAGWLEALRRTYGYEPVVYTTAPPGAELSNGFVFCKINTWFSERRLVSVPFSDHAALLNDEPSVLHRMFSFLQEQVRSKACKYVEIRPSAKPDFDPEGFVRSARFSWHRLSLRDELPELYRSFHKNCVQRKIRRAEREDLKYTEGRTEDLIQRFYRLLVVTHLRHCLPPQPISWFRNLMDCCGEGIKIRIASKDGQDVASIITLTHKKSMVYKYGSSDARYHNLGGMVFLFWRAIQDAKNSALEELDMGRSDCENLGLIGFKDHWNAEQSSLEYWGYPARLRPDMNRWQLRAARKVFTLLPTAVLPATGQLLYKHMG